MNVIIYISDLVAALTLSLNYTGTHRIFNIGSGEGKSVNEIIEFIEAMIGKNVRKLYKPFRPFDVRKSILDISLAKIELGWHPEVELAEGIQRSLVY